MVRSDPVQPRSRRCAGPWSLRRVPVVVGGSAVFSSIQMGGYAAAGLWCGASLAGDLLMYRAYLCAAGTAVGVYALHRARMARVRGLCAQSRRGRRGPVPAWLALAAAAPALATAWWALRGSACAPGWLLLFAVAGVHAYGTGPVGRRVRDTWGVKNAVVGVGLMGFLSVVGWLFGAAGLWRWVVACGILVPVVVADASLCDIADRAQDRRQGTRSLPVTLGPALTRRSAVGLNALAGIGLIAAARAGAVDTGQAVAWGAGLAVSALCPLLAGARAVRFWADLRFPIAAGIAWWIDGMAL